MLQTGTIIRQDLFTLAAEVPRWEHCWLHDIICYGVYQISGYAGLSLLKGVLLTATLIALLAVARLRGGSFASLLLVTAPAIFLTKWAWLDRPQLWSFILFALFILLLERYRLTGGWKIFFLVPLMALWLNLHAGAVLGLALIGAYLVAALAKKVPGFLPHWQTPPFRPIAFLFLLLPLVLLLTPFGLAPLESLFVVPNLGSASGAISQVYNYDWQATTFTGFSSFFYAIGVVALLLVLNWRRLLLSDLLLLAGLGLMGFKLARHIPFFFLAGAALLPYYVDALVLPFYEKSAPALKRWLRPAGFGAITAILLLTAVPIYKKNGFFDLGLTEWHWPVAATEFVREHRLPTNLFNTYNYGEYLSWRLYPDYKVFFDSRQNSPEMFFKGMQVSYGIIGWQQVLDDHQVNTVVAKPCTTFPSERYPLIDRLGESAHWALVFADRSSLVFVRRTAVDAQWLSRHELGRENIDETVLAEAQLLVEEDPRRYNAWWEIVQVYLNQMKYPEAFAALNSYLATASRKNPKAQEIYPILNQLVNQNRSS